MDTNMVFMIPVEFHVPMEDVVELAFGVERAVFEKAENLGTHMKPLFIRGHLDGTSVVHMLMDGGPSINILPLSLFKKLDHIEGDLKCTNLSLSGFTGDPTEATWIICKELTIGSKTVPMAFSMVDVKGRYNVLLINASSNGSAMRWRFKPMRPCASPWLSPKSSFKAGRWSA
jgi:hypothetical protein